MFPPENITISLEGEVIIFSWEKNNVNVVDYIVDLWEVEGALIGRALASTNSLNYDVSKFALNKEYKVLVQVYCGNQASSDFSNPTFFDARRTISPPADFSFVQ